MNASYKIERDGETFSIRLGDHERPFIGGFESPHEAAEWVLAFYQTNAEIAARRERRERREAARLALTAAAFLSGWEPPPGRPVV